MKKKILLLCALLICSTCVVSGTIAYYTDQDTAHNVITSGGVHIDIEEWQEVGDEWIPYPKDEPIAVMPATTVSKIVTVRNQDAKSYIRAQFTVTVKDADDQVMELDQETLESIISIVPNNEYWLTAQTDDGWYYYKDAVDTDKVTDPLFREVVFSGVNMTNEYQNCTVEIDVDAQAVQTANNGNSVLEAAGWPAE